jgi:hypothetical protein
MFHRILKEKWKDIIFARVTRVVTKASDANLWTQSPKGQWVYLGDSRKVHYDSSEKAGVPKGQHAPSYDYFFGFCKNKAGTYYFTSSTVAAIDWCAGGDWTRDVTFIPPQEGDLICGVVQKSEKGLSFVHWCPCPEAFMELCRIIQVVPCNSTAPTTLKHMDMHQVMKRLRGPSGPYENIYQAIATRCIFNYKIPPLLIQKLPHYCLTSPLEASSSLESSLDTSSHLEEVYQKDTLVNFLNVFCDALKCSK